jgi:AraC-like DNA-binding protein
LSGDELRPEARVPYVTIGRVLLEGAQRTRCAHFGLLAGRMWRLADLGLLGEIVANSATVGEALQTLTVYQHLNSGGGLSFLMRRGGTVDVGYAIYQPGVDGGDHIYDSVLAFAVNFMRELCGPGWLPTEVLVPHATPRDVWPYRQLLKGLLRFDSEFCALRFPEHWLEQPISGGDRARHDAAMILAERAGRGQLVEQVTRALRLLLLHGRSSGDDVAQMLAMHRRTLNRRLRSEGTTFQSLLDVVRFDVACQLLGHSRIAIDDIAATLGYASASPFMRTFRRWSGTTPARWRRAAAAGQLRSIAEPRKEQTPSALEPDARSRAA